MKHGLLALAAVIVLAIGAPASAQYMYIDVNGDGLNTTADVLSPSVTSVDIWLATNKSLSDPSNLDSPLIDQTCKTDASSMTINSYQIIFTAPAGGITYGAWTDNMGFTIVVGDAQGGNDNIVGRASAVSQPPGTYKLGSMAISVVGNPVLTFAGTTSLSGQVFTCFGSQCGGINFDNTLKYNDPPTADLGDWTSIGPTRSTIPVTETTWGKIKTLYNK